MGSRNGRSSSPLVNLFQTINDDVKDFVDDEVLDRVRDTERDGRRAGRRWYDDDEDGDGRRGSSDSGVDNELDDLRDAVKVLTRQVDAIVRQREAGLAAVPSDLPIADYDNLTVGEITSRLPNLSQDELAAVKTYERSHAGRSTVLDRVEALQGTPPWPEYDEQTVVEIRKLLGRADEATLRDVRNYERRHKARQGVLDATEAVVNA